MENQTLADIYDDITIYVNRIRIVSESISFMYYTAEERGETARNPLEVTNTLAECVEMYVDRIENGIEQINKITAAKRELKRKGCE